MRPSGAQSALNGSGRSSGRGRRRRRSRRAGLERLPLRGGRCRSRCPARSARGATPTPGSVGCRGRDSSRPAIELAARGFPAWDGFIAAVERSAALVRRRARTGRGLVRRVYRPHGRPWRPGERVRLPALGATLDAARRRAAGTTSTTGDLAERQARALAAAGVAHRPRRPRAPTPRPGPSRSAIDYRGVRVDEPSAEQLGRRRPRDPRRPRAVRAAGRRRPSADGRGRPALDPPRDRGVEAGDGRPRRAPDRPGRRTTAPLERLLVEGLRGRARRRIDPARRGRAAGRARCPRGGGTIYLGVVDGEGNAVSLIESNYMGFGSGVRRPGDRHRTTRTGARSSASTRTTRTCSRPAKRTLHTLLPGMLFRDGPAVGRRRLDGRRRPAADPRPGRVGPRRRRRRRRDGGRRCRAGSSSPAEHFAPPDAVRAEPRFAPGLLEGLAGARPRRRRATEPFDAAARPLPRDRAGRRRPAPTAGRSRRRPTRGAPGCPPPGSRRGARRAAAADAAAARRPSPILPVPVAAALTTRCHRHRPVASGRDP